MKKTLRITIAIVLLLAVGLTKVSSQVLQWAKTSPSEKECSAGSVARDVSGNFFIIGTYSGTVDFDPGPATHFITTPDLNASRIFLQKLDPDGNLLWVKTFGGSYQARGSSITVDASGDVIVAVTVNDAVDFDPGAGELIMGSVAGTSICTVKYDSDGNLIWGRSVSSQYPSQAPGKIVTDAAGNIYLSGSYQGQIDFDFGDGVTLLSSTYNIYIGYLFSGYITKVDKNGNFAWAQSYGNSAGIVDMDPSGNILLSGGWFGTTDFDPGPETHNLTSVGQGGNTFALKLTPDGNFIFVKGFRAGGAMALDATGGFYMAGVFAGEIDFDPNPNSEFILSSWTYAFYLARYTSDGIFQWAKQMTSESEPSVTRISVAPDGDVFFSGNFGAPVNLDPEGSPDGALVNNGSIFQDNFLCRFTANGSLKWAYSLFSTQSGGISDLRFDQQNNLLVLGGYSGTIDLDFNPQAQFNLTKNTADSGGDYFLAKYSLAPIVNCPSGNLFISKMAQLNSFPAGCPQITGDLTITGDEITSLSALTDLKTVTGNFSITSTGLTDLNGLGKLTNVGGTLEISSNTLLTSLQGLDHNNPAGRRAAGNLRVAGTLAIQNLIIADNPVLTNCAVEFVADYLELSSATSTISNNGTNGNCNSAAAIMTAWQTALPVNLISFDARTENAIIKLAWATSAEENSDRFEIERATNGKSWIKIGAVKSHGSSATINTYSFEDISPLSGSNYYRLKMVDRDGTFAFSRIRNLKIEGKDAAAYLYPNPTSEMIYFDQNFSASVRKVEVFDSAGRLQLASENNPGKGMRVAGLKPGVYIIRVASENRETLVKKLVIGQ